jgi:predicted HicB family RNase H-like nuclease
MGEKEEEIVRTTLRIPRKLWDQVRHRAIIDRLSLQELVIKALSEYVKKGGHQ